MALRIVQRGEGEPRALVLGMGIGPIMPDWTFVLSPLEFGPELWEDLFIPLRVTYDAYHQTRGEAKQSSARKRNIVLATGRFLCLRAPHGASRREHPWTSRASVRP